MFSIIDVINILMNVFDILEVVLPFARLSTHYVQSKTGFILFEFHIVEGILCYVISQF